MLLLTCLDIPLLLLLRESEKREKIGGGIKNKDVSCHEYSLYNIATHINIPFFSSNCVILPWLLEKSLAPGKLVEEKRAKKNVSCCKYHLYDIATHLNIPFFCSICTILPLLLEK